MTHKGISHIPLVILVAIGLLVILLFPTKEDFSPQNISQKAGSAFENLVKKGEEVANNIAQVPSKPNVNYTPSEKTQVGQVIFLRDTLTIAKNNGWNGTDSMKLPVKFNDYGNKFETYLQIDKNYEDLLNIPAEKTSLYDSESAKTLILENILAARTEFLLYLKQKGVNQKYISEIENNTLPGNTSRITYVPDGSSDAPLTAIEALRESTGDTDFTKLTLSVSAVDIYNSAASLAKSQILGNTDKDLDNLGTDVHQALIPIAIRDLVYHEMTHVLQRAYDSVNITNPDKKYLTSYWNYVEKPLWQVDKIYFKQWGGDNDRETQNNMNNRHIANESQADGVAYEILTSTYNLIETQKKMWWEQDAGRFEEAAALYDETMEIFKNSFPNYRASEISGKILEEVIPNLPFGSPERVLTFKYYNKLGSLAALGGYMHPMRPERAHFFWEALK